MSTKRAWHQEAKASEGPNPISGHLKFKPEILVFWPDRGQKPRMRKKKIDSSLRVIMFKRGSAGRTAPDELNPGPKRSAPYYPAPRHRTKTIDVESSRLAWAERIQSVGRPT